MFQAGTTGAAKPVRSWRRLADRYGVFAELTPFVLAAAAGLAVIDLGAVVSHIAVGMVAGGDPVPEALLPFRIDVERGVWTSIGYAKLAAVALLLVWIAARTRVLAYFVMGAVFAWLGIDDAFMVHEQVGVWLAGTAGLEAVGPIPAIHLGELAYFVAAGALLAPLLWIAFRLAPEMHRANVAILMALVLGIGFFAAGVDFFDQLVMPLSDVAGRILGVIEDVGENAMVSLAIVFLLAIGARLGRDPAAA